MDSPAQSKSSISFVLYKFVPITFSIGVLILNIAVLFGWLFNIVALTRVLPSLTAMNPLTAVSFVCISCSFIAFIARKKTKVLLLLGSFLALLVMVVMSAHFFQLISSGDSIIDLLIFRNKVLNPNEPPARLALSTATCFLLLGWALAITPLVQYFRSTILSQLLAVGSLLISFVALVFYLSQQVAFFEIPFFFGMALHTAASFFILSLAFLIFVRNRFQHKIILTDIRFIIGLLIFFLVIWFGYIKVELLEMSRDFSYKAEIFSTDNLYDIEAEEYSGEILSNTKFSYQVVEVVNGVLNIKNTFDVKKPSGESIFFAERLYGIDRFTGQHVAGFGDKDRAGYLFGPRNANKEDFTYWHINYDQPATMTFAEEEDLFGLRTYKYVADYTADQTADLGNLPEVGETKGITLDIHLELWIEPRTGRMIKYQDEAIAYYYDLQSGEKLYPWNKFNNHYTTPAVEQQVILTNQKIQTQLFIAYIIPGIISLLTFFFIIAYLIQKVTATNALDFLPIAVFIFGMILSSLAWYVASVNTKTDAKTKFDSEVQNILQAIDEKMNSYDLALQGTRGLLEASDQVSRTEWKSFIDGLNLPVNFAGVQGIGYSVVLQADEVDEHQAAVRAEGFPDYQVRPLEPARDEYTAIVFLEPFDLRNQQAFGYDMFSEENRRKAMTRARNTDETAISGRVTLLQEIDEDVQPGFLMYVPFYEKDVSLNSVEDREQNLLGYVYGAFRARDLMTSTFINTQYNIYLEILDGNNPDSSFENNGLFRGSLSNDQTVDPTAYDPRFISTKTIDVYGQPWTLSFFTEPNYSLNPLQEKSANILFIMGVIFTVMLTYLINVLIHARSRALNLANEMTEDLQKQKQNLIESNAKDEAMLLSIGDGLIATDNQGMILFTNPSFEKMLGWKQSEVVGKKLIDIIPLVTEEGKKLPEGDRLITQALEKREMTKSARKNVYYITKFKKKLPVSITVSPIIVDGKVTGVVEVFRDITKESEVDKAKTEFVSLASHQLKTPLSAINWYGELLLSKESGKLTHQQSEYLDEIITGSKRMVDLVNALLNVSRLELGTFSIEPSQVEVLPILRSVLDETKPVADAKNLKIIESHDKLPSISADPNLTRIIIQNILTNAIKYTPEEGSITISLKQVSAGSVIGGKKIDLDSILYQVSDTGYGIPQQQQKKIFTKLFRADNVQEKDTDGTGLGLYIIKSILDSFGGAIWFESEENKGTTFYITLPLTGMKAKQGSRTLELKDTSQQ